MNLTDRLKKSQWISELRYPPKNYGQIVMLFKMLDELELLNVHNMEMINGMESKKLDMIFYVSKTSSIIFLQIIDSVFVESLQLLKNMFDADNEKINQVMQDIEYLVRKIITKKIYDNENKVFNKTLCYLKKLINTEYYQSELYIFDQDGFIETNSDNILQLSRIIFSTIDKHKNGMMYLKKSLECIFNKESEENALNERYDVFRKKQDVLLVKLDCMNVYNDYMITEKREKKQIKSTKIYNSILFS